MNYLTFLQRTIDDGICTIEADYSATLTPARRDGSLAGLAACRGQDSVALLTCLTDAKGRLAIVERHHATVAEVIDGLTRVRSLVSVQWHQRYLQQVRWICEVMSAFFMLYGEDAFVIPSDIAFSYARKILDRRLPIAVRMDRYSFV